MPSISLAGYSGTELSFLDVIVHVQFLHVQHEYGALVVPCHGEVMAIGWGPLCRPHHVIVNQLVGWGLHNCHLSMRSMGMIAILFGEIVCNMVSPLK